MNYFIAFAHTVVHRICRENRTLDEVETFEGEQILYVAQVSSGEVVQNADRLSRGNQFFAQVGADKSGSPCNKVIKSGGHQWGTILRRTPAAMALPITPAMFGAIACINR